MSSAKGRLFILGLNELRQGSPKRGQNDQPVMSYHTYQSPENENTADLETVWG